MSMLKKFVFTIAVLFLSNFANASQLHVAVIAQPIDHFGQFNGTFAQRYWIDSEFAAGPNAPVIYRLCGEDTGDYFVSTDSSQYFAQMLHAHVVYIENRYYGQSQPFKDQSNDHMRYLTLDNVIEDAAYLQRSLIQQNGMNGKWIVLGGSYSGTMSAIYRLRHPELVVGALAASAPMFTKNFASDNSDLSEDEDIANPVLMNPPDADRAWAYQSCTTFGFWLYQSGSTVIYQPSANLCAKAFGLAQRANYDAYNQAYFAPFVTGSEASASNILFSSGSNDTWALLSINAQNNHNPSITVLQIQGAGHHFDLDKPSIMDSAAVKNARNAFLQLAQKWLGN